jgi:predicted transcriptional regulator
MSYIDPLTVWKEPEMSTLTIRIDSKLERDLARLAKAQKKTKSEIAREMLRRHMLVRDLNDIRAKLQPYAEAAGYLTDEDFFRDIS